METAYQNFFAKRAKFPKFKTKKKSAESYREPQVNEYLEVKDNKITLLKLGWVKLSYLPKDFHGKLKFVTKSKANEYYVSILTEQELVVKARVSDEIIGLDLGLTDFISAQRENYLNQSPIKSRDWKDELDFGKRNYRAKSEEVCGKKKTNSNSTKYLRKRNDYNHIFNDI